MWRVDWPVFLAFLNLVASLVVFMVHMLTHLRPWPSNAPILVWVAFSILAYTTLTVSREEGQ